MWKLFFVAITTPSKYLDDLLNFDIEDDLSTKSVHIYFNTIYLLFYHLTQGTLEARTDGPIVKQQNYLPHHLLNRPTNKQSIEPIYISIHF